MADYFSRVSALIPFLSVERFLVEIREFFCYM